MTKRLFVGLGSPHGDDQIGWQVVNGLTRQTSDGDDVRVAATPADLLDWLDGVDRLIVIDACRSGGSPGTIRRWTWPEVPETRRGSSSHDLGLVEVLTLAARLGRLPPRVEVTGIEILRYDPGAPLSPVLRTLLPGIVASLWIAWNHAGAVAGGTGRRGAGA